MRIDSVNTNVKISNAEAPKGNENQVQETNLAQQAKVNKEALEKKLSEKEQDQMHEVSQQIQEAAIEQANRALLGYNKRIDRAIHEKTKTVMYKIVDTKTDEVIKEFPPKKIQDMVAKMWELAGLFVDEKA